MTGGLDWGALFAGVATIIAALLALRGVLDRSKTDAGAQRLEVTLKGMQSQIDGLKADLEAVKAESAAAIRERDEERLRRVDAERRARAAEDLARDREELLEDWRPIGEWLLGGARPPIPVLSWRIEQERAEHERALERQREGPPPASPGAA